MKRLIRSLLCLVLAFALVPLYEVSAGSKQPNGDTADLVAGANPAGAGSNSGNDNFSKEVSRLVRDRWSKDYFSKAVLNVEKSTLKIDNKTIKLRDPVVREDDEWMLTEEVLQAFGIKIKTTAKGATLKKNGVSIDITYGDNNIKVNGHKERLNKAPISQGGRKLIPSSVLEERGLGFEFIKRNENKIIITNDFQTMRLLARVKTGEVLPTDLAATEIIASGDGLYVIQFDSVAAAKSACEMLNAAPEIVYAEADSIIVIKEEDPEDDEFVEEEPIAENEEDPIIEADPVDELIENGTDESLTEATYSHHGWAAARVKTDQYMDYLIANGKGSAAVTVAIVDTGLYTAHPLFSGRIVAGYNIFNDNTNVSDQNGHGTHVAGTVIDMTSGMNNVKVQSIKVFGSGNSTSDSLIVLGIRWAWNNGAAKVMNLSLGGTPSKAIDDEVKMAVSKGITVVVAAGNEANDAYGSSPARVDEVITVAAIDNTDTLADFSNFGSCIDIAAPGVYIQSAGYTGGYVYMDGTSMASPHVAGIAALVLCDYPSMSPANVKIMLIANADMKGSPASFNFGYGYGILNAGNIAANGKQFVFASLNKKEETYNVNTNYQFNTKYFNNGTVTDVTSSATYNSDTSVVSFPGGGAMKTGANSGKATVTVSYSGRTDKINVVVYDLNKVWTYNNPNGTLGTKIRANLQSLGQANNAYNYGAIRKIRITGKMTQADTDFLWYYMSSTLEELDVSEVTSSWTNGFFSYMSGLTNVRIPANIKLADDMFYDCQRLATLKVGGGAYVDQVIDLTGYNAGAYGNYAFGQCYDITKVRIPANVVLSRGMFLYCVKLTTLQTGTAAFNNNIVDLRGYTPTYYGAEAFAGCEALTEAHLSGRTALSNYLFALTGITKLRFTGSTSIPAIGYYPFDEILNTSGTVYVPSGASGFTRTNLQLPSGWTVVADASLAASKDIISFTLAETAATINNSTGAITVSVPYGTNVTSTAPAIGHTGVSITPASLTNQNFKNPVVYTVKAIDGTTKTYTVTVTVADPTEVVTPQVELSGDYYMVGVKIANDYPIAAGYEINYSKNGKKWKNLGRKERAQFTAESGKLVFYHKSLANNKRYYYRVRAYRLDASNNVIYSAWSIKKSVKTLKYKAPALSISLTQPDDNEATTKIKIILPNDVYLVKSEIFRGTSKKKIKTKVYTATPGETSYTDTGLKPGTTYYYKVKFTFVVNGKTVTKTSKVVKRKTAPTGGGI